MSAPTTPAPQRAGSSPLSAGPVTSKPGSPAVSLSPSGAANEPNSQPDRASPVQPVAPAAEPPAPSKPSAETAPSDAVDTLESRKNAQEQYKAGKLLYAGAKSNPMLLDRQPTPVQAVQDANTADEMRLQPISTHFDVIVKQEPDPPSTGLIDQTLTTPSDPNHLQTLYSSFSSVPPMEVSRTDSTSSAESLQVVSPTQMSPRPASDGATTLPHTPAASTFPFGYNYQAMLQASMSTQQFPVYMPDISQSSSLGYNSGLDSVESTSSAFGYNLSAYSANLNQGVTKGPIGQSSSGLANTYAPILSQQAMASFNSQCFSANPWPAPQHVNYIAPETLQTSPAQHAIGTASPLRAMSPTPSDSAMSSDDDGDDTLPGSAPARSSGVFAMQQDGMASNVADTTRPTRRATMHALSTPAVPSPRRSTRRRSSVGLGHRSRGPTSDGSFSGKRAPLVLDEDERARYERESKERDEARAKEMQEFELGPMKGNRKERRRMQNRLAQRSFRARSKIQNQEAMSHMRHLEALTEAQQTRLLQMQELTAKLQRENVSLKAERWTTIKQLSDMGVQIPEGLANFSVSTLGLDTVARDTAQADYFAGAHRQHHVHTGALGLATMDDSV